MKLKWKVGPEPQGRFRSFEKRGWPSAWYPDGKPAAFIYCDDAYEPWNALSANPTHAALTVNVCHHNHPQAGNSWKVFTLKMRPANLAAAKEAVRAFVEAHPSWAPKEEQ